MYTIDYIFFHIKTPLLDLFCRLLYVINMHENFISRL